VRRYLYFSILLIPLLASCTQSTEPNALLLSKVLSNGKLFYQYDYNPEGKLISMERFGSQTDNYSESYEYYPDGLLAKRIITDPYGCSADLFEYNEKNLAIGVTTYFSSGNVWAEEYEYDSKGRILGGLAFTNGEKTGYMTYKYDGSGNTIERKEFTDEDFLMSELRFEYDKYKNPFPINFPIDIIKKNNVIYSYAYHASMSSPPPEYSSTFEYNSEGLPIKEIHTYKNTTNPQVIEYVYISKIDLLTQ
jgi:hypothetical protein